MIIHLGFYHFHHCRETCVAPLGGAETDARPRHLTEGGQSKHLVELPLPGVPDEVSGVAVLLRAVEPGPPEVRLAKQGEHTQLPVDLRKREHLKVPNPSKEVRLQLHGGGQINNQF